MYKTLLADTDNRGCLTISFNRPEKRNAVNFLLMEELEAALKSAKDDEAVKVLVLTGTGSQAFCSGGDLSEFHDLYTEEEAFTMLSRMGEILYKLATFPKPTIAMLNGSAIGGGCEIAAACDFRVARKGIKVGFVQGTLGITTGWGGASLLLEKLPVQQAMKLLLDATVHSSEQAQEIGFIDRIVDIKDWESFAQNFLRHESGVLMAYKKILVDKWKAGDLKGRMEAEIRECAKLWETEAHHLAVSRFLHRKK